MTILITGCNRGIGLQLAKQLSERGDDVIGVCRKPSAELAANLHEGSKVAIVSSRVGSIEDNSSGGNWGYRASKTAVNMIGTNLMHELKPRGIAVALLHPGLVATEMTGGHGIEAAASASGLIQRIDALNMQNTGGFWHAEGYRLPW